MLVMDHMLVMVRELPTIATFTTPMHKFCRDTEIAEAIKLKGVMELCDLKLILLITMFSLWACVLMVILQRYLSYMRK